MSILTTPYVLKPEQGEPRWFAGFLVIFKAQAELSDARFSLLEQSAPHGTATPMHVHPGDDEAFYVLDGDITFHLENTDPIPATAGTFINVPGKAVHGFRVESDTARVLEITTQRHEQFMRAASDPAVSLTDPPSGPPDMEQISAAAQRFGVEIVGPPPGPHTG